ncbi:MAG: putative membrane protein [Flavobacterium sp.]|jgi:uncharacterized membrane protein
MTLFNFLLIIHIFLGGTGLLLGIFAMFSKKGDKRHKLIGNIYYCSMLGTGLIAMILSYLHPSQFLFIIAVFTLYMILTGKRYLKKKKISDVKKIDWLLTLTMFIFGTAFIGLGANGIVKNNYFGIVLVVFGGLSLLFVYQDYRNFKGQSSIKNFWLTTHLQRMVGSFIAAFTAFIVVNNTFLPEIVAWLLPTFALVPLIIIWRRKYQIKIDRNT